MYGGGVDVVCMRGVEVVCIGGGGGGRGSMYGG